jgi:hypothetical protein
MRLVGSSPTRASDPRTEITRPKEVGVVEADMVSISCASVGQTMRAVVGETVKPAPSSCDKLAGAKAAHRGIFLKGQRFQHQAGRRALSRGLPWRKCGSWHPIAPLKRADVLHGNRLCAGRQRDGRGAAGQHGPRSPRGARSNAAVIDTCRHRRCNPSAKTMSGAVNPSPGTTFGAGWDAMNRGIEL